MNDSKISSLEIKEQIKIADELYSNAKYKNAIDVFYPLLEADNISMADRCKVYKKLGYSFYKLKDFDSAICVYEQMLKFCTADAHTYDMLGYLYFYRDNDKSIEYYLKEMELKPDIKNFVMLTQIIIKSKHYELKDIKNIFEKYVDIFRNDFLKDKKPFSYDSKSYDKNKKLKIGYLSSDFHGHAMMTFVLPILEHHNKENFDINLYDCSKKSDHVTERIKNIGYNYNNCTNMTNEEIADKIHSDNIDILVDLSGYTHKAIWSLIYKPAPVIVQYLGFLGTYGMKEVDYILADKFTIPENFAKYYTEKPMYIECGMNRFCFNNKDQTLPDITPLPVLKNNYITFGSFNCTSKLNTSTILLWSKVLNAVPNSKLLIYRTQLQQRDTDRLIPLFNKFGISPYRVIFDNTPTENSHFKCYDYCDIALDPTPFSGLTITIEQALMGVPVVTLNGMTISAKGAARINNMLGQDNLIAGNEDEYIKIAKNLSRDVEKLKWYRENYRQTVLTSKLFTDYETYVRQIEEAYEKAWADFCES